MSNLPRFPVLPRPYGPPPLALCPCPPTPVPSLCDNMAGAFLSACLSSFPDIASNLRGISYFLPAFVVSMCLWIYSVSRSGVSRSVLRCVSVPCLLLFSCFRPSAHCPAAFVRLVRLFSRLAVSVFTASLSVVLPRFRAFTFPWRLPFRPSFFPRVFPV